MDTSSFVGMTKKQCQDTCEAKNLVFRLISKNGEPYFSWPEDQRSDRVCVIIENDVVTKATLQ